MVTTRPGRERFGTTEWSMVIAAGDSQDPGACEALERLCSIYWYPVYGFVRQQVQDASAAQDLTQEFFCRLLEKNSLRVASPKRGRFRSFLLGCARNFLANERDREHAAKRGGGRIPVPLDLQTGEARYRTEPADDRTPDKVFEKRWALTVIDHTLERLGEETRPREGAERSAALSRFLTGDSIKIPYRQIAAELGMTEAAVKAAIHRRRRRFGQLLRDEIERTVTDPDRIDDEIRYLFAALQSS